MDTATPSSARGDEPLDVARVYELHGRDLWVYLHRLGVPESDLADAIQDVLVVVHRRLGSFDHSSRLTTWLFGICLRVASNHRRRLRRRREDPLNAESEHRPDSQDPERLTNQRRLQQRLRQLLDELDPDKRAVFVMFELEGLACWEMAELLGVPVGTVHSRLHAARKAFKKALTRLEERERHARVSAFGGTAFGRAGS